MRIRIGLMTLPILRFLRELFRPNPSPIHRNIRIARVNDLYVLLHLTATVMTSGSLTYLVGCGVAYNDSNQTNTSHIKQVQIY